MNPYSNLPGPDFLDAVAEAELHNGNEINHREFKGRARQWQDDRLRVAQLEHENSELKSRLSRITAVARVA